MKVDDEMEKTFKDKVTLEGGGWEAPNAAGLQIPEGGRDRLLDINSVSLMAKLGVSTTELRVLPLGSVETILDLREIKNERKEA